LDPLSSRPKHSDIDGKPFSKGPTTQPNPRKFILVWLACRLHVMDLSRRAFRRGVFTKINRGQDGSGQSSIYHRCLRSFVHDSSLEIFWRFSGENTSGPLPDRRRLHNRGPPISRRYLDGFCRRVLAVCCRVDPLAEPPRVPRPRRRDGEYAQRLLVLPAAALFAGGDSRLAPAPPPPRARTSLPPAGDRFRGVSAHLGAAGAHVGSGGRTRAPGPRRRGGRQCVASLLSFGPSTGLTAFLAPPFSGGGPLWPSDAARWPQQRLPD
jgi:hypothetical protein